MNKLSHSTELTLSYFGYTGIKKVPMSTDFFFLLWCVQCVWKSVKMYKLKPNELTIENKLKIFLWQRHYLTHTQCVVWCQFEKWSKPKKKKTANNNTVWTTTKTAKNGSLRSWRYCVGARLKFWRRSRVPKKKE